jgi:predicted GIY-YIG superfamily endonuclease
MGPCSFCGSTGDWKCIKCPSVPLGPPRPTYAQRYRVELAAKARERYQATKHLRPEPPGADVETTLYRMFDAAGSLLYVGITHQFEVRLAQHRRYSEWFSIVDHWTTESYPTRRRAKFVETAAIRAERPRFNRHESVD